MKHAAGIKAAGYTLAATVLSREFGRNDVNPFGVGAVRTLIGMGAGALFFGAGKIVTAFWKGPEEAMTMMVLAIVT